jgi:hypothetical protein
MLSESCKNFSEAIGAKMESLSQKYSALEEKKMDAWDQAFLFAGSMFQLMLMTVQTGKRSLEETLRILIDVPIECIEDARDYSLSGDQSTALGFLILSQLTVVLIDLFKLELLAKNL